MRLEDFPHPKDDNRRGVHWSASVYHPTGAALDFWINELQATHIKWVKLLDDSGGSSLELCERLLAADIMPIVRLYRLEPNPGTIGGREESTIRTLVSAGVRYFETNNEPDLPTEWADGHQPANWFDITIDNFIHDADKVISLGGLPAVPAMGVGARQNPVARVVEKGRGDLFESGAWVAIHNYTLNHPLDYPYDSVNQEGTPVSQEEYDRLGDWAWEGRPRELINQWRATDRNPGATLADDPCCFLAFSLMDEMINQTLGFSVPIISTEGGPVMGWKDDQRYPRVGPATHSEMVVAINDFMQGNRQINGLSCPPSYFTMCFWLLANYRLGFMAPGWESQSWYTDWWNPEFGFSGEMPVVAAVKAMPNLPIERTSSAEIYGRLLRTDTNEGLAGLKITLLEQEHTVATTTTAADGGYRFSQLAPGAYDLAVAPWGTLRRGVMAEAEPLNSITIWLSAGRSSVLSGSVMDASNVPQPGIGVTLRREKQVIAVGTTQSDGSFRFSGLPLGSYELSITGITVSGIALDGWAARSVKLTAGVAAQYRYVATTKRRLPDEETAGRDLFYGTVCDASGNPLDGITLEMSWLNPGEDTRFPITETGTTPNRPAGYYEFYHTRGVFALRVTQGDWLSDTADGLDTTESSTTGKPICYEVNFRLQPYGSASRIAGSVPGGQAGMGLTLVSKTLTRQAVLDGNGQFAFENVPPGGYRLSLAEIGCIAEQIQLGAGALHRIVFSMKSKVSGKVLQHFAGTIAVLSSTEWGWTRQIPLATDGSFAFAGLPAGHYRLEVGDQVRPDIELNGENVLVLPDIDPSQGYRSTIRGRVADGQGQPQADVQMVLRRDGILVAQTNASDKGLYQFVNLPAGIYTLEAGTLGEVATGVALDGDRELARDVLWPSAAPRGSLQGKVFGADGSPRAGTLVRLLRGSTEIHQAVSDGAGAYRFAELAAGSYALAAGTGGPGVTGIRLTDGATLSHDMSLPPGPPKLMRQYLLFGGQLSGDASSTRGLSARLALDIAMRYVLRTGSSCGFKTSDAAQAERVIIVGDDVPQSTEHALRLAGCEVSRLSGDSFALAAAFRQMFMSLGEG